MLKYIKNTLSYLLTLPALFVLWIGIYFGLTFMMMMGMISMGTEPEQLTEADTEAMWPIIAITAALLLLMCIIAEIRGGGLQKPWASVKQIGRFTIAVISLACLWFATSLAASLIFGIVAVIVSLIIGSSPETLEMSVPTIMQISAIATGAGILIFIGQQWRENRDGVVTVILASAAVIFSLISF